jgi:cyclopropane fatty-acyl-phospholipid synthase-like methyltransferase
LRTPNVSTAADPRELYTKGRYLENNPGWHVADSAWKAKQIIAALRKANLTPRWVCDIGCGAGEVIRCLADEIPDCEFHGYELSPQAYDLAKTRETDSCRYFQLDGVQTPQREHYDVAMAIDVVEHVEDYFGFLRQLKTLATYKLLHVPLELSALGVLVNQPSWARRTAGHVHYFSVDTLLSAMTECGFTETQFSYTAPFSLSATSCFADPRNARAILKAVMLSAPRHIMYAVTRRLCARILGGCSVVVISK